MPALIFSNACQSARTEGWAIKEQFQDEIFGLANAFLLSGVKHYVGTFWEILDEPGRRFALEFYKQLLAGQPIGEAIRQARLALIKSYGEETIVWASYILYGDPTFNYMDQIEIIEPQVDEPIRAAAPGAHVRAHEEVIDFAEQERPEKKRSWWAAAAGVILLVAALLWGYPGFLREETEKYGQVALTHYKNGRFQEALDACGVLKDKNPGIRLAYLIPGNVFLREGNLDAAQAAYEKAVQAPKGTDVQKAKALRGLGRIASLRNEPNGALRYYKMATDAAPQAGIGYVSQAMALEGQGDYEAALDLLEKAQSVGPENSVLAAVTEETRKKVALANDKEKQARVDQLVEELLETMKTAPPVLPSDGWTSSPLTLWLMDFKVRGYSVREGEARLLASGITDHLIQNSRARVVERTLLDKLLDELRLGTSQLADQRTALSLGRILAAKVIVFGQLVFAGPETQVSVRLVETETGRITGVVNESFGSTVPVSVLSDKLSHQLSGKLKALYPLQGRISAVTGDEIRINIGDLVGVQVGQHFRVVDQDVTLEVVSTESEESFAKVTEGEGILEADLRIKGSEQQT
jgi:tetratricopeptide (TPR) repeat protein